MSASNAKPIPESGLPGPAREAAPKTAKLFKNGRSQAVRLPKEFRFEGNEVMIRRDPATGDVVLAAAPESPSLSGFVGHQKKLIPEAQWEERFATWDALGSPDEDAIERDQTPPVERDFF